MRIKLFCLPYAGGSAAVFYKFRRYLSDEIELCPVELAGRGKRIRTPRYQNMQEAAEDVFSFIKGQADNVPYALFGHSLGSIISYETVCRLEDAEKERPVHVFFSGSRPPHMLDKTKMLHTLPDKQFIEEIMDLGGTDKKIFENKELSSFYTALLKADFKLVETYNYVKRNRLIETDISVFNGRNDKITYKEMLEWQTLTSGSCKVYEFSGDHFFINSCTKEIIDIVNRTLEHIKVRL